MSVGHHAMMWCNVMAKGHVMSICTSLLEIAIVDWHIWILNTWHINGWLTHTNIKPLLYSQLLASSFHMLCFLDVHWFFFVCVYMGASSLDINFSLVFHYSISKPKASNACSTLVFDYYTSKQATQTQCSWSAQSCGLESLVWLRIWLWEECWLRRVSKVHNVFGVRWRHGLQGWIRDVNQNFGRASHEEQLGETYTWCTVFVK